MRNRFAACCVLVLLAAAATPVSANICAVDNVPAATLLFPYLPVDYGTDPSGASTILSITNMSWEAQVLHVTLWTDFGQALMDFNIILTGYDVIRFDIGDIFFNGQLPVTVSANHTSAEGVQDRGPMSSANSLYGYPPPFMEPPIATSALGSRCDPTNQAYPGLYVTPIPPAFLALFQNYLQVSQTVDRWHTDDCDIPYGDPYVPDPVPWFEARDTSTPAWIWATVDVNENCHKLFPDSPGYFASEARTDNVLTGDVLWISENAVASAPAVHIEADVDLDEVATAHFASGFPISFYHRYAVINDAVSDYREPLPTAWAMRYEGVGTDFVDTSFLLWKGSTSFVNPIDMEAQGANLLDPDNLVATNCLAYTYYAWDEDENVVSVIDPDIEINQLPLVTQKVEAERFDLPANQGWILFIWPPSNWATGAAGPLDVWQTWMGSFVDFAGTGRVFLPGNPTANWGCFSDQTAPLLGIDYDYVDSGGYVTSPGAVMDDPGDRQAPRR